MSHLEPMLVHRQVQHKKLNLTLAQNEVHVCSVSLGQHTFAFEGVLEIDHVQRNARQVLYNFQIPKSTSHEVDVG